MTLTAVRLPVDAQRGVAACFHYGRALELELVRRCSEQAGEPRTARLWLERAIVEHGRIARGFLGAVGFEAGSRLYG